MQLYVHVNIFLIVCLIIPFASAISADGDVLDVLHEDDLPADGPAEFPTSQEAAVPKTKFSTTGRNGTYNIISGNFSS